MPCLRACPLLAASTPYDPSSKLKLIPRSILANDWGGTVVSMGEHRSYPTLRKYDRMGSKALGAR